jgi:MoaA/NifB/PqqE/SkfB family radical SAM enzyme
MNSNGTLWREEHYELLSQYPPIGVTVSLDGNNAHYHDWLRGDGVFDKAIATIQRLRTIKTSKGPVQVDAICVLNKQNILFYKDILDLASELGIRELVFSNLSISASAQTNRELLEVSPSSLFDVLDFVASQKGRYKGIKVYIPWATPIMIHYYNQKHRIKIPIMTAGCHAIRNEVTVSPQGYLRPCPNAMDRLRVRFGADAFPEEPEDTLLIGRNLSDVRSSPLFERFYELLHGPLKSERLQRCTTCKFYDRCSPCPSLRFVNDYPTEKLCYAFQDHYNI